MPLVVQGWPGVLGVSQIPLRQSLVLHTSEELQAAPGGLMLSQTPFRHEPLAHIAGVLQGAPLGRGASHRPFGPQILVVHWAGSAQGKPGREGQMVTGGLFAPGGLLSYAQSPPAQNPVT